jgi:hypothetical protein
MDRIRRHNVFLSSVDLFRASLAISATTNDQALLKKTAQAALGGLGISTVLGASHESLAEEVKKIKSGISLINELRSAIQPDKGKADVAKGSP